MHFRSWIWWIHRGYSKSVCIYILRLPKFRTRSKVSSISTGGLTFAHGRRINCSRNSTTSVFLRDLHFLFVIFFCRTIFSLFSFFISLARRFIFLGWKRDTFDRWHKKERGKFLFLLSKKTIFFSSRSYIYFYIDLRAICQRDWFYLPTELLPSHLTRMCGSWRIKQISRRELPGLNAIVTYGHFCSEFSLIRKLLSPRDLCFDENFKVAPFWSGSS